MPISLNPKQAAFLAAEHGRVNLLIGAVRSGKTFASVLQWLIWLLQMPENAIYLMAGRTIGSLKDNCLKLAEELSSGLFEYSAGKREASFAGRYIILRGAYDSRSSGTLRGLTLGGAYVDEVSLVPEEYFDMLLSRLSVDGARLYATTNPDSPEHWLKKRFVDAGIDAVKVFEFSIADNCQLGDDYVRDIKRMYSGVFYDRFILGKWVNADGLIYTQYQIVPDEARSYTRYYVSCDYGTLNPTVFLMWGQYGGIWHLAKEYYYSGRDARRNKTDSEYADDFMAFVGNTRISACVVDPSAASFIAELSRRGVAVRKADNDVLNGIRETGAALACGNVVICGNCHNTLREFGLYSWDSGKSEDAPVKANDHAMDAMRYFVYTILKRGTIRAVSRRSLGGVV